eukprot:15366681-Ditylum_brightwellii.AAC.1
MVILGLDRDRQDSRRDGLEETTRMDLLQEKSDMENIVVEMDGEIFKGEADIIVWVEQHLPSSHPFR